MNMEPRERVPEPHERLGVHHHHRGDGQMVVHRDDDADRHDQFHADGDLAAEPCGKYHPGQTFRATTYP